MHNYFNIDLRVIILYNFVYLWASSSLGRALPWHGRGKGFESPEVHHYSAIESRRISIEVRQFFWLRSGSVLHISRPLALEVKFTK